MVKPSEPLTNVTRPLRLAAIITSWEHGSSPHTFSHAEVILKRWLQKRPSDRGWGWAGPYTTLASVYVEQLHDHDEIHPLCRNHGILLATTIDQALTLATDELAVDAVLLIGEHGEYPRNALGQKLYPRKELYDQIVAVYERCSRSVPVFCDKHLSWNFHWAREMTATADRLGFMLFGGSVLPHCPLSPPLPPLQVSPSQVVAVYAGDIEAYGFHSLELVQSQIEHRRGGERGVRCVTVYEGAEITAAQERGEWSSALFDAAIAAGGEVSGQIVPRMAMVVDHADGLRCVHINLQRGVRGWALAMSDDAGSPMGAAKAVMGDQEDFFGHFAALAQMIEETLLTNRAPFPSRRTLLTTGTVAAAMRARSRPGTAMLTPELAIAYTSSP